MNTFAQVCTAHQADFERLGIDQATREKLIAYLERLWAENQNINLVSRKLTPLAIVLDHLFDCLIALPHMPASKVTVDLGSGGGLPAAVLALCRPDTQTICFEKSPLKTRFLNSLTDLIPNLETAGMLQENILPDGTDLITARGFKPIKVIRHMTRDYARAGGTYALYKGRAAKIQEELQDAKLNPNQVRIQPLKPIGNAEERALVLIP